MPNIVAGKFFSSLNLVKLSPFLLEFWFDDVSFSLSTDRVRTTLVISQTTAQIPKAQRLVWIAFIWSYWSNMRS